MCWCPSQPEHRQLLLQVELAAVAAAAAACPCQAQGNKQQHQQPHSDLTCHQTWPQQQVLIPVCCLCQILLLWVHVTGRLHRPILLSLAAGLWRPTQLAGVQEGVGLAEAQPLAQAAAAVLLLFCWLQ